LTELQISGSGSGSGRILKIAIRYIPSHQSMTNSRMQSYHRLMVTCDDAIMLLSSSHLILPIFIISIIISTSSNHIDSLLMMGADLLKILNRGLI